LPKFAYFNDSPAPENRNGGAREEEGAAVLIASGQGGGEAFRIPVGQCDPNSCPAVLREEEEHRRSCNKGRWEEEKAFVCLGVEPVFLRRLQGGGGSRR